MEPQQSPLYAQYMKRLKWEVATVDGVSIFLKRFPFAGTVAKMHRPEKLPPMKKLLPFFHKNNVRRLIVEPSMRTTRVNQWVKNIPSFITLNRSPFLATKTIRIDLKDSIEHIFDSFTEAKRRAVRRAIKLGVTVKESQDIDALISVKNSSAGIFGFITTSGIRELWETFSPKNTSILLALESNTIVGGVLLLFWDHVAYYWIAGGTKQGKKYFAPTLLVWEALQLAKKKGAREFDFVGVWDERLPKENVSWRGFTKFKEGFGGETQYYPLLIQL